MQKTIALNSIKSGQNARVAMAAVLGSESIFFITLISAYFYLRSDMSAWPMAGASLMRLVFPAANTTLLLVSALSFYLGLRAVRKNQLAQLKSWLAVTLGLGLLFIAGQVLEFTRSGMKISDQAFGGVFFTLMGFHAIHVLAGVVMLVILLWRANLGDFTARWHAAVQVGAWFWYFVSAVWVVLFTALYLV
jgi:heme/copper-type cytochrome/quinol oxidase subunit 3